MSKIFSLLMIILLAACSTAVPETIVPPQVDTGVDPNSWALIEAGEFLWGQFDEEVLIDYDYEMMVTPVTNAQFAGYLNAALADGSLRIEGQEILGYYPGDEFHGYDHEEEIAEGDWIHMPLDDPSLRIAYVNGVFEVLEGYADHPVTVVTWFGAKGYCEYQGGWLPSEMEWEKAARGTQGLPFPWGDEIEHANANYYASRDPFEEHYGRMGDTTPVGLYSGISIDGFETIDSPSPYGLYDMAGNVEEWTGNVYENQHYRYLRGGSKLSYEYDLRTWATNNVRPDYFSPSIGFRCAQDAQN